MLDEKSALNKWGYKVTRANKEKLRKLCKTHPELCNQQQPLEIKGEIPKPYLLVNAKHKEPYTNIAHAVKLCSLLYSESINIDIQHLLVYLKQMEEVHLIQRLPNTEGNNTLDYGVTLKTEEWLKEPKRERIRIIKEALSAVIPDIHIHTN